jgi:protein-tyrosine phosphatase
VTPSHHAICYFEELGVLNVGKIDHGAQPDAPYLPKLEGVTFRPVFIMGLHRSGTTLLHRLLAETGRFNYVSAYHVLRYERMLDDFFNGRVDSGHQELSDLFRSLGLTTRIIDETPAVPEAPIEYGFLIMRQTNARPRITEKTLDVFKEMGRKLQVAGGLSKPLLLKNPWDEIYFLDIKRWFPDARFVFIHRHPLATLNSQTRAMRSLFAAKNEFSSLITPWYRDMWDRPLQRSAAQALAKPPFLLWEKLMTWQSVRMLQYYLKHFRELPAGDCISLRYEDLCREPDSHMKRITDFLGVTPPDSIRYGDKIAPRESKIPPEVKARFEKLRGKLAPYLKEQGYET